MRSETVTLLLSTAAAALAGSVAGGFAARAAPMSVPIAVIDINGIVKESLAATKTPEEAEAVSRHLSERMQERADELVREGVIVLDGAAVVRAPEEAYVAIAPASPAP
ncbi:hypothetical protein [Methylococcus capsulatus]|uniref:hypothetical protein n=1 Tax=Methylococcus capsulatus TaxID=414 RepID=UPI001C5319CF|nr:hypothetical protein [Methylococcus capsulatus]QXP89505.1 hypothetical protein KW114_10315 [Methylococcus capsulatus]